jgi:hypothetical protein
MTFIESNAVFTAASSSPANDAFMAAFSDSHCACSAVTRAALPPPVDAPGGAAAGCGGPLAVDRGAAAAGTTAVPWWADESSGTRAGFDDGDGAMPRCTSSLSSTDAASSVTSTSSSIDSSSGMLM